MKIALNIKFIYYTIALFSIEVLIALYSKQPFIRFVLGDYLVVILLYTFFKSFINTKPIKIAMVVLIIAYITEFLQYFHVLDILNVKNKVIRVLLGTSFSIGDLVAYTFGIITVLVLEKKNL